MTTKLELNNVSFAYGEAPVLRDLSLRLADGAIGCLLGSSGCGKTTVLRAIGGFEALAAGEILINGQVLSRPGSTLAPEKRSIGIVFQDAALFPHLTVARNIAFGLRRATRDERDRRVDELLETIGLREEKRRYPHELSGGQRQRVALARALAPRPDLLLLDEAFSSLDLELRERLTHEVRRILKHERTTALLVTHSIHEAFAMADEIGVMHEGHVRQWATPDVLYHRPADRVVANFVGKGAYLPATVAARDAIDIECGRLQGELSQPLEPGDKVDVLLRPEYVRPDPAGACRAEVVDLALRGSDVLYTMRLPGGADIVALIPSYNRYEIGDSVVIGIQPCDYLTVFRRD